MESRSSSSDGSDSSVGVIAVIAKYVKTCKSRLILWIIQSNHKLFSNGIKIPFVGQRLWSNRWKSWAFRLGLSTRTSKHCQSMPYYAKHCLTLQSMQCVSIGLTWHFYGILWQTIKRLFERHSQSLSIDFFEISNNLIESVENKSTKSAILGIAGITAIIAITTTLFVT